MDVVGSEIGHKMRSAIKAKLTELGCYVDDELPDYVMVMVANKRTRSQMEDDLQLFLGDNTELFVNWLHQVLKKLQEVTIATPLKSTETESIKERSTSKERKLKDKKEKSKKSDSSKKAKKKAKEKAHKKKEEKKKSKKKSKHEMIRPNIPPLLMNIEKESEPSITDVFAGQILKNHGIIRDTHKEEPRIVEQKPTVTEIKRPIIPIIDPASIPSQTVLLDVEELSSTQTNDSNSTSVTSESVVTSKDSESIVTSKNNETCVILEMSESAFTPEMEETIGTPKLNDNVIEMLNSESREEKIKEMKEIEAKIQGLKQKLADQLGNQNDLVSDDEDFLNIRTEADELITDFAEDVFQEISQPPSIATPPLHPRISHSPTPPPPVIRKVVPKDIPETLPHIELNLPKRPIRERLGAPIQKTDPVNEKNKEAKGTERVEKTPERLTPEIEPEIRPQKSAKSRLGNHPERTEQQRKKSTSEESTKAENNLKRLSSRVSVLEKRPSRVTCASIVRVRPRPRGPAPASSLLFRAVADAHKSLLNMPLKVDQEPQNIKRALVLPMRRSIDPKKIVIQVPCTEVTTTNNSDSISDNVSLGDLESGSEDKSPQAPIDGTGIDEYTPISITKVIHNTEYIPSRTLIRRDDTLFVETINIHNTTVDKDKDTQFIVTMDGYHPNAFLAKKLMTEGLLNDHEEISKPNTSDKTEISKKGPVGLLKINKNKGTKDMVSDAKTKPAVISSQLQVCDKVADHTEDTSNTPELEINDNCEEDLGVEIHHREISITIPHVEKRNRDSSVEKTKSESSVENSNPEKRNSEMSPVKSMPEKRKISVDKPVLEKRKSDISIESSISEKDELTTPPVKKRKASPIIFDVHKKEKVAEKKEKVVEKKERTTSSSSEGHIVLTTTSNTHKYDTVPPLSPANKPVWCRAFPQCRYGASCVFAHPRCKFAAACTRRGCVYSHAPNELSPPVLPTSPVVASHVVPAANYKSISAGAFANICKFYPSCSYPACHYYHPKPCRYGKACTNKLECNFYHHDVPGGKWKYGV